MGEIEGSVSAKGLGHSSCSVIGRCYRECDKDTKNEDLCPLLCYLFPKRPLRSSSACSEQRRLYKMSAPESSGAVEALRKQCLVTSGL